MESGNKKTLEGLTIGQKRKRNDGMNNVTINRHACTSSYITVNYIVIAEQEPQPKPRKIRVGPMAELIEG